MLYANNIFQRLDILFPIKIISCLQLLIGIQNQMNTMAERLNQFYEEAQKMGGLKAKIRLAVITKTPSAKAATIDDSNEMINIFKEAIEEIKKEFN